MGTQQSNDCARDFFYGLGGVLERGAGAVTNTIAGPGNVMNAMANYLNSPLSGITLPIIILGGLYVASQVISKKF